jgi:hypothetical protein
MLADCLSPATPNTNLLWEAIFAVILWIFVGIVAINRERLKQAFRNNKFEKKLVS